MVSHARQKSSTLCPLHSTSVNCSQDYYWDCEGSSRGPVNSNEACYLSDAEDQLFLIPIVGLNYVVQGCMESCMQV
jgi:hypothetical protein